MNTIEEILKKKNENIFEAYARTICPECENKDNDRDLCNITKTEGNTARCFNYSRCMQNKCNTCKEVRACFKQEYVTAKKHKPIMKGINR